jgi:diaminohydroxyphosphoribosylaminopyrimidine deaminase / 5-amino-6-(5-phosphoribosylamino)uracil reductase
MTDDREWMRRALRLAERGSGETNPNPLVGCVVVKAGRVVGEAWHRRAGGPHAEVAALARAGARARGATLYVNLEPCVHQGRTPPCAPRVAEAGVRRVVAAMRDPDARVDGRGVRLLRRAGIAVTLGVLKGEAEALNERFLAAARRGRPWITLKAALTLDGRIATARGESKWITSPAQRRDARRLRRLHDAVAVGIGTVLADDPMLLPQPRVKRPFHRVVFDSRLRLPLDGRLARSVRSSPVWVVCAKAQARKKAALERRGVTVVEQPSRAAKVSLSWAVHELWRRGIRSLLVEGGSELLGAFRAAGFVDAVALYRAPLILGGREGVPAFGGPAVPRLAAALALRPASAEQRRAWGAQPGLVELWYPLGSR